MTGVSALAGTDLVLGYQRTTVVHGVSVELDAGVVTALIGPNGSGKSTVLRSLARLHHIDSGGVSVADDDAALLSAKQFARRVTLLSQSRPHPSGLEVRDVAAVGTVAFVGLVAPHMARALVGGRHVRVVPIAILLGAVLLGVADVIGRTVIAPAQLPAGLCVAIIGAPYFVYLLARSRA